MIRLTALMALALARMMGEEAAAGARLLEETWVAVAVVRVAPAAGYHR